MTNTERKILGNLLRQVRNRCDNPKNCNYASYGAKGIHYDEVVRCADNLVSHIGPRPSDQHSLDRYPNQQGGYCYGNLRWATAKEQANNRRTNVLITHDGRTQSPEQWAAETGIRAATILQRAKRGLSSEQILSPQRLNASKRVPVRRPRGESLNGRTQTIKAWAAEHGISYETVKSRLRYGMSLEAALNTPVQTKYLQKTTSPSHSQLKDQ